MPTGDLEYMTIREYRLSFVGYWREANKSGVPADTGVFCVYTCTFDMEQKKVSLKKLLYIDSSANARQSIAVHSKHTAWMELVQAGEQLCYSFAPVQEEDLELIKTVLIGKNKTALNETINQNSNVQTVQLLLEGMTAYLK